MRVYTCFVLLCSIYTTNSWTEYIEQIDEFRTLLLNPKTIITEDILNKVPKFGDFDTVAPKLYQDLEIKGEGQDARVWVGKSIVDRPNVGIVQGQTIAIRGARIGAGQEKSSALGTLKSFVKAQNILRNPAFPITEFFPTFYGTYEANGKTKYSSTQPLNFQEMEAIDNTLANLCKIEDEPGTYPKTILKDWWVMLDEMEPISDCVVFEFCLGEWAGAYFAQIGSNDAKTENAGVKKVDYSRSYQIQGRKYIIPKTELMPKRIDIGGTGTYSGPPPLNSYSCSLKKIVSTVAQRSDPCKITQTAENFMKELAQKREGSIFEVFDSFYEKMSCKAQKEDEQNHNFVWPEIK